MSVEVFAVAFRKRSHLSLAVLQADLDGSREPYNTARSHHGCRTGRWTPLRAFEDGLAPNERKLGRRRSGASSSSPAVEIFS